MPIPSIRSAATLCLCASLMSGCAMLEMPSIEQMRAKDAADARRAIVSDPSPDRRADAARTLGRDGGAPAIPLLAAALRDDAPLVRRAAVDGLGRIGADARAVAPDLLAALNAEPDPGTAIDMAWQLRRWGSDLGPAVPALRRILDGPDARLRYHAAILLEDLVPAKDVVTVYLETAGASFLSDMRNKPDERIEQMIPADGAAIWPLLEQAATATNAATRVLAATVARHYRPFPASGAELLAKGLRDADAPVRAAAAWSCLMASPEPVANAAILRGMLDDPDPAVRVNVARALGQFAALGKAPAGSADAISALLEDRSTEVRESAAIALGSIRGLPEPVVLRIASRVDSQVEREAVVRAAAAAALGFCEPLPRVRDVLRRGFDDVDETVRHRCIATTGHLGIQDPDVLQVLAARTGAAAPKGERLTAIVALNDIGPAAKAVRDALVRAAGDPDPDIRDAAGFALQQVDR